MYKRRRGLHDIKTCGTLARKGEFRNVARDLHKARDGAGDNRGLESSDWSISKHVFNKGLKMVRRPQATFLCPDLYSDEQKIKRHQIQLIQGQLQEMNQAMVERIPVSVSELERLKTRLAQLRTE